MGEQTLGQRLRAKRPDLDLSKSDAELEADVDAEFPGSYADMPRTVAPSQPRGAADPPGERTLTLAQRFRAKGRFDPEATDSDIEDQVDLMWPGAYDDVPRTDKSVTDHLKEGARVVGAAFDPVTIAKGVGQMVAHPIETVKGISASQQNLTDESRAAFAEGNYGEYGAKRIAAAIPLFGPGLGAAFDDYSKGDWGKGTGELAAAAIDIAGPKIGRAVKSVLPPVRRVPDAIPLAMGERGGLLSPATKFLSKLSELTIPGRGEWVKFRKKQQAVIQGLADDVIESISKTDPAVGRLTTEGVGASTVEALNGARAALKADYDALYKQVDEMGQGVLVPTGPIKAAVRGMLAELKASSKLIDPPELKKLNDMLSGILKSDDAISFYEMREARTTMMALTEAYEGRVPRGTGVTKRITEGIDNAIIKAAEGSRVPGLAEGFRNANALYKESSRLFNDTIIKRLLKAAPEKIPEMVRTAPLQDIRDMFKVLPKADADAVRASIMADMFDKASTGELNRPAGTGSLPEKIADAAAPLPDALSFSGDKLRTMREKMGSSRLDVVFGRKNATALQGLQDAVDLVMPKSAAFAPQLMAAGMNAALLAPLLSLATGGIGVALAQVPSRLAATGGGILLAKFFVSQPRAITRYESFLNLVNRGDISAATSVGLALSQDLARWEKSKQGLIAGQAYADSVRADKPRTLVPSHDAAPQAPRIPLRDRVGAIGSGGRSMPMDLQSR
tara:strand:- start:42 stop:2240 length:2199 start_codon:yes stop_codon:yes gene_type:complete